MPETFVVGRDGKIAFKLVGPISEDNLQKVLLPAIEKSLCLAASLSALAPLRPALVSLSLQDFFRYVGDCGRMHEMVHASEVVAWPDVAACQALERRVLCGVCDGCSGRSAWNCGG